MCVGVCVWGVRVCTHLHVCSVHMKSVVKLLGFLWGFHATCSLCPIFQVVLAVFLASFAEFPVLLAAVFPRFLALTNRL